MSGDFDTSEELKAEIELKKLEELIAILPQDIPLRKDFECQLIIWKVKAKRWRKKSEKRVIKINGVHRNEQINIVALCAGHQIIMCDNEMKDNNEYYLLIPMQGRTTPLGPNKDRIYLRNKFGLNFEEIIYNEWGKNLTKFPCRYVARVCPHPFLPVPTQYSLAFWEEIEREGFFDFWDPEGGPVLWHKDHHLTYPHVKILRVFEIDEDLRPLIEFSDGIGKRPYLSKEGIDALAVPVLTDEEFNPEYQRLLKIFQEPRYHL